MITSAAIYHVLHFFHVTIDIRNVCVFLAPLFSSFTTIVTYHLTKELKVSGAIGRGTLWPVGWPLGMGQPRQVTPCRSKPRTSRLHQPLFTPLRRNESPKRCCFLPRTPGQDCSPPP